MWDGPELAECYDRVSDLQFESGRALIARMNVREGNTLLDVGCGTGRLALYVSQIVGPAGRVTGIDPSPHRIRIAEDKLKAKGQKNLSFRLGRGEDLRAFPDGNFRHVCYSSVFHWVGEKAAALREAHRVLKPGGTVGITTIDRNYPFAMKKITEQLIQKYPGMEKFRDEFHRMLLSREELEELLQKARFKDIQVSYLTQTHHYSSPQELFDFMKASSFGNFMREVPDQVRPRIMEDLGEELEKLRTDRGIEISSDTMIVVAARP